MTEEEKIKDELIGQFGFLADKVRIQRQKRIFADIPSDKFLKVLDHVAKNMSFPVLITIIGTDEGETFGIMYLLARDNGITLNLKINIPRDNPVLKTVTEYYKGCEIYERELADLFGIKVQGLKEGKRYPLPDDWPAGQYPLRKDWTGDMLKQKETK